MATVGSDIPICRRQPPSTRESIIGRFLTTLALYNCVERDIIVSGLRLWQEAHTTLFKEAKKYQVEYHRVDFYTGSFCEGMPREVCGDFDTMFKLYNWPDVLIDHPSDPGSLNNGYLYAETVAETPPKKKFAFLRLRAPPGVEYITNSRGRYPIDIHKALVDIPQAEEKYNAYLSSSKFAELNCRSGHTRQGPANFTNTEIPGMTVDGVPCLQSPSWPPCASKFLTRPRTHGWPSPELIDCIKQTGCHVVGIGHPESSNEDKQIEWRWSFSIAERELIHNFTDDMAACMYLLKAFKKKYWYDDTIVCSDEPSIFCSYFFKTACLWVFESTQQDESDAISLCRQVFDWLISCYKNGFLPHYFIPQQNLIGHILGEKGRLESLKLWLQMLKFNIWIIVIPSIQIDATLKSVMKSTATELYNAKQLDAIAKFVMKSTATELFTAKQLDAIAKFVMKSTATELFTAKQSDAIVKSVMKSTTTDLFTDKQVEAIVKSVMKSTTTELFTDKQVEAIVKSVMKSTTTELFTDKQVEAIVKSVMKSTTTELFTDKQVEAIVKSVMKSTPTELFTDKQVEAIVKSVMKSTTTELFTDKQVEAIVKFVKELFIVEQLNSSSDCTYKAIIYASYEYKKADEILGKALRGLQQTFLTKLRLTCVKMYNEHYPPINSFLNMFLIRKFKEFDPSLPEINEHELHNEQLSKFNQAIDRSPLSVFAQILFQSYQPIVTKLLEVPEELLKSILAKKNLVHPKLANSNYVSVIHLLLGDVFWLLFMKLPNVAPKELKQILADKAEYFYRKTLDLVYPDGWSDKGLTGYVLLAKLYYDTKDWDQLKDVLIKLEPLLKEAEGSPAIMESLAYINVLEDSDMHNTKEILTPVWDTSARLHHPVYVGKYLLQQMERKAREIDGIELD